MLRKEGTHLFWAGNGGIDRGNNFCVCCSASSPASPFSDVCCGTDTWGYCQRWGLGRVCAPLGRMGNGDGQKKFCVFLKRFSLFVIRDIPFLGSSISFFDIPIRPDSGSPNKGLVRANEHLWFQLNSGISETPNAVARTTPLTYIHDLCYAPFLVPTSAIFLINPSCLSHYRGARSRWV